MRTQTTLYFEKLIRHARELDPKEKTVLMGRLRQKTLQSLGKRLRVSGERIRQLENQALAKFIRKTVQLFLFE